MMFHLPIRPYGKYPLNSQPQVRVPHFSGKTEEYELKKQLCVDTHDFFSVSDDPIANVEHHLRKCPEDLFNAYLNFIGKKELPENSLEYWAFRELRRKPIQLSGYDEGKTISIIDHLELDSDNPFHLKFQNQSSRSATQTPKPQSIPIQKAQELTPDPEDDAEDTIIVATQPTRSSQSTSLANLLTRNDYNPFNASNPRGFRVLPDKVLATLSSEDKIAGAKYECENKLVSTSRKTNISKHAYSPKQNAAFRWGISEHRL